MFSPDYVERVSASVKYWTKNIENKCFLKHSFGQVPQLMRLWDIQPEVTQVGIFTTTQPTDATISDLKCRSQLVTSFWFDEYLKIEPR